MSFFTMAKKKYVEEIELQEIPYSKSARLKDQEIVNQEPAAVVIQESFAKSSKKSVRTISGLLDQNEKYVLVILPFDFIIKDKDVEFDVTSTSFNLYIKTELVDYKCQVPELFRRVRETDCFRKVDYDIVTVYLKKAVEHENWESVDNKLGYLREDLNNLLKKHGFKQRIPRSIISKDS